MADGDAVVHDAVGPDIPPVPAAAAIAQGAVALIAIGMAPVLLGAMVDEHRMSAAGIGIVAMLELLAMGVTTALAGAFLKPEGLPRIGAVASLMLAAADVAAIHAHGLNLFILRAIAGVPEGVMLWITVGFIARTRLPERWSGVFFTTQVLAQLLMSLAFAVLIIPRFGADGGLAALAFAALIALPASARLPERFALIASHGAGGPPPLRGLAALAATVVLVSSSGAVGVYLQPLAHRAGLGSEVARTALWASFAAQVFGGALATALAGRIRYLVVFGAAGLGLIGVWVVYAIAAPAWLFIGASAFGGAMAMIVGPFLVPMTIEADPSRRAAMQSGGAQLLGGALGPLLAALVVGSGDTHGVLWLGAVLLCIGLAMAAALHFTTHRPPETGS